MVEGVAVGDLAGRLGLELRGDPGVEVSGVTHDSRAVGPGMLFCCVPGDRLDGHLFAADAVAAGAVALVVEHAVDLDVAQLVAPDVRSVLGPVAAEVYRHPDRELNVVGVTGTNGKTTTVSLIAHVLHVAGRRAEVIGTLTGVRTTPEATEIHARLRAAADAGCDTVAMEVSSHALALHRVDALRFAVAVFTNLGTDHLDFHGTPERYFEAKARLFDAGRAATAVIDVDSPHGRLLRDTTPIPVVATSVEQLEDLELDAEGARFSWRGLRVRLPLLGRHNVANALLAAEACRAVGVEEEIVAAALGTAPVPAGRFELVPTNAPFRVVVDFAHTPDALAAALEAARVVGSGSVIVVFGCGGDRDPTKRPRMGAVADELADTVILTSDNPRSEDPSTIMAAVGSGMDRIEPHLLVDRGAAIAAAIDAAGPGDVVLIAGKGHESTQSIGDAVVPFDDRLVAADALVARGFEVEA